MERTGSSRANTHGEGDSTTRAHAHGEGDQHTRKERDSITHEHTDGEGGTAHALTHAERETRERVTNTHMGRENSIRKNTHEEHTHTYTHRQTESSARVHKHVDGEWHTRTCLALHICIRDVLLATARRRYSV